MTIDITALRKLLEDCGTPELNGGCLLNDNTECNCPYIFDEGHSGGVGKVFIDNGAPIGDGGNDAPSIKLAQAYLRLIVGAVNALPALLDELENK